MLEIKRLSVFYGKKRVLSELSLAFPSGSFTAILGKNGTGKSTLLSAVAGLASYTGDIRLDGDSLSALSLRERACRVAFLPQHLTAPPLLVRELVSYGRNPHLSFPYRLGKSDLEQVEYALLRADAASLAERPLDTLSGGERTRAYLAMIFAQSTSVLLLDEPASAMDIAREGALFRMLAEEARGGKTVLASMHSLASALRFADRILILDENGECAFFGTREECLADAAIEKAFGVVRYTDGDIVFFAPQ